MTRIPSLFAASLLTFLFLGCNGGLEDGDLPPVEEASTAQELVTCSTRCGTYTTLSCSGTTCSAVDGPTGYVTCDGVTRQCQLCTYDGNTYPDGTVLSGECTAKVNGYCIGGPDNGKSCVSTGDCYAKCYNGTWR